MTIRARESILTAATVLACIWACRELISSWHLDPDSKGSAAVFAGWVGFAGWQIARKRHYPVAGAGMVALAAFLFLCGRVTDLAVISHLALAIAVASFLEGWLPRACCVVVAFSWFPALGWFGQHFLNLRMEHLRGLLAMALVIPAFWLCRKNQNQFPLA